MATPAHSPSPSSLVEGFTSCCSSPTSDQRFWSNLRQRTEYQKLSDESSVEETNCEAVDRTKRLKEDSMLLIRGFDSVSQKLSHLSSSLDNALQGAAKIAKPPTLTEIAQSAFHEENFINDVLSNEENRGDEEQGQSKGTKRKLNSVENDENREVSEEGKSKEIDRFKKVKNLAISMAAKAATLARELKSIKSDLRFEQERCALLEEENNNLRQGLLLSEKAVSPEEDDLVRLQLEALLAEKSRLANENTNLIRENRCLHQLVEYHELTSQDVSASYENLVRGMCLDFESPAQTNYNLGFNKSLNKCCFDDEDKE